MQAGIVITEITGADTYELRNRVLDVMARFGTPAFAHDDAPGTFHLGAYLGDELIGISSFVPTPHVGADASVQVRGMAVRADAQGLGIGTLLLDHGLDRLARRGDTRVWADGRLDALGFYLRHGWTQHGAPFEKAGITCVVIVRDLADEDVNLRRDAQGCSRSALPPDTIAFASSPAITVVLTSLAHTDVLDHELADQLDDALHLVISNYLTLPPSEMRATVPNLQRMYRRLEDSARTEYELTRAQALGARVYGVAAKLAHDAGEHHEAALHVRTGRALAQRSRDRATAAWLLGLRSLNLFFRERYHDAIEAARTALAICGRSSRPIGMWLAALEARAAAGVGDPDAVVAALSRLDQFSDLTSESELDSLGGLVAFPDEKRSYYLAEAAVIVWQAPLSAHLAAAEALGAYAARPNESFSDLAGARATRALAYAKSGDLDAVALTIAPVLQLPDALRINGVVRSVARVRDTMQRAGVLGSFPDRDRIDAFCREGTHESNQSGTR